MNKDQKFKEIIREEISSAEMKPLFDKLAAQLGNLDKSIDFLAAAITGMDPLDIEIAQSALGRLATPKQRIPRAELEENKIKLTKSMLREIVKEVLLNSVNESHIKNEKRKK